VPVGQGHSAVSIKDGFLYTQGSRFQEGSKENHEEVIFCLNALTGETVWQTSYAAEPMAHNGPRATPTVDGERVFTLGSKGDLLCCDAKTGTVLWKKNLVSEHMTGTSKWGFSTSPVVDGERLILNVGSAGLALNKTTGDVIWKSGLPSWGLATPVLTDIQNRKTALLNTEYILYAVDVVNGSIVWQFPWAYCDADPVLIGEQIYVFGGKPDKKRSRMLISVTDASVIKSWDQRKMNVNFHSWIARDGFVYGITWDKKSHHLQCFDIEAGKVKWNKKLDDWAAFTLANGFIILLEADGDLAILEASPKSYKVISKARVLKMENRDKASDDQPLTCWTSPVLSNGKVYVRSTHGEIACVDVSR